MSDVKIVDQLPEIDQNAFPTLPEIPEGRYFMPFGSVWSNAEKEFAASIIVTAAVRAGKWVPVSVTEFVSLMQNHPGIMRHGGLYRDIMGSIWLMEESVEVVKVDDMSYAVPKPELGRIISEATAPRIA